MQNETTLQNISPNDDDDYEHYSNMSVIAITLDETEYIDSEKQNGNYVICSVVVDEDILVDMCISAGSFVKHKYEDVLQYMNDYSMFEDEPPAEDLEIVCYSEYGHVIKTPYLRIFQRKWREYYKKKMRKINQMKSPNYQYMRSIIRIPYI